MHSRNLFGLKAPKQAKRPRQINYIFCCSAKPSMWQQVKSCVLRNGNVLRHSKFQLQQSACVWSFSLNCSCASRVHSAVLATNGKSFAHAGRDLESCASFPQSYEVNARDSHCCQYVYESCLPERLDIFDVNTFSNSGAPTDQYKQTALLQGRNCR